MDDATRRRALLALVVLILVVLAVIGFARGRDGQPAPAAAPGAGRDQHRVRLAGPGSGPATLLVVGGTDGLTIVDADLGGDLADARTPDDSRVVPYVQRSGSQVTVGTRDPGRTDRTGPALLAIRLSRAVTWTIRSSGV